MIGFHTWYRRQGITYLAIQLAELAESLGHPVSFMPYRYRDYDVNPCWDNRVERGLGDSAFDNWVGACSHVVWPEFVLDEHRVVASKAHTKTILIPMWEQLKPESIEPLYQYDYVIAVSRALEELLQSRYNLKNVRYVHWHLDSPSKSSSSRQYQSDSAVKLYFPSAGPQARRNTGMWLEVLGGILHDYEHVEATVSYLRRWPPESVAVFKRLRDAYEGSGRLTVVSDLPWHSHNALYADNDLTVWPTTSEGLGLIGLEAIAHGTPVLAFDISPVNEYLSHGRNAWLVPCRTYCNDLGVPFGVVDPDGFDRALRTLIEDRDLLHALQCGASAPSDGSKFVVAWQSILAM